MARKQTKRPAAKRAAKTVRRPGGPRGTSAAARQHEFQNTVLEGLASVRTEIAVIRARLEEMNPTLTPSRTTHEEAVAKEMGKR